MWKYQGLLNQNIQILLEIGIGAAAVLLGPFREATDLPPIMKLVFHILLPCSVFLALGIKSDLRQGDIWRFVGGFLLLRALVLLCSILFFGATLRRGLGVVTINWLIGCWVSSVILGVPLVTAALGQQYSNLGVLAGISSFIFQLPTMLFFFEVDAHLREQQEALVSSIDHPAPSPTTNGVANGDALGSSPSPELRHGKEAWWQRRWRLPKGQAAAIGKQLLHNPILWAIVVAFIVSITTLGPKYLDPGETACIKPVTHFKLSPHIAVHYCSQGNSFETFTSHMKEFPALD